MTTLLPEPLNLLLSLPLDDPDAPEWAQELAANQLRHEATLTAILAKFDELALQIKPLIDTVSKHPMMKMMGLGK